MRRSTLACRPTPRPILPEKTFKRVRQSLLASALVGTDRAQVWLAEDIQEATKTQQGNGGEEDEAEDSDL